MKVDSTSPKQQAQCPPTDTDSVSVKVENLCSGSELSTEVTSIQSKWSSLLKCFIRSLLLKCYSYMPTLKPFYHPFYCLVFVCFAPVIYACVTVATVAALALSLIALWFFRLLRFSAKRDEFDEALKNKGLARSWILVSVILLFFELALFYPFAKYVPGLQVVIIIGLPIIKWIKIICLLIGLYILSQVLWASIVAFAEKRAYDTHIYQNALINPEATYGIFGCLLFWWAEGLVMDSVPAFKQSKIIEIYTQEWIEVCLFVVVGYNIISCFAQMFVWLLLRFDADDSTTGQFFHRILSFLNKDRLEKGVGNRRYVVYIASGIKRCIIFILSVVMLLLTWELYISRRLNLTSQDKRIMEFGTWTLVSVLICSLLWLIKSCILLYWELYTVYFRLHSKFTDFGKQLYFLVLLSYTHFQSVCVEQPSKAHDDETEFFPLKMGTSWALLTRNCKGGISKIFSREGAREDLINRTGPNASTYELMQAAEVFLTARYALSKEGIFEDLHHLQSCCDSGDNNANIIELLEKIVKRGEYGEGDWELLSELLSAVDHTNEITFQKVQIWMERAHNRCKFLANTLQSGKEEAKCLNQILSGLIIAATVIIWLFLTGLATTAVIALIASPLLATTFVFGDTAKGLFQGLIFVYSVHPFDVGDLCVIDEKLLEVKRIGVWCTTFSKVRTVSKQQEIIYPNSGLATKNVINYKTEFDWTDYMELSLSFTDEEGTKNLKHQIETYLETEKERFTPKFHSVEILEIGDKDKIAIHLKHNVQAEGWIYFECLREKEKRKSEFALYLRNLLNQQEFNTRTPSLYYV